MARVRSIDMSDDCDTAVPEAEPPEESQRSRSLRCAGLLVRSEYVGCQHEFGNKPNHGRQHEPRWDGGTDNYGHTHQPVWPSIAVRLMELDADPRAYIRAQFHKQRRRDFPLPNQLTSEYCIQRWANQQHTSREILYGLDADRQRLATEVLPLTVIAKWEYIRALRYVLLNEGMIPGSPLYRYCLATREGLPDVAEIYHDRALMQYTFQTKQHDEIWGDIIPVDLRNEAAEIRLQPVGF